MLAKFWGIMPSLCGRRRNGLKMAGPKFLGRNSVHAMEEFNLKSTQ
jgi:hypothetical protein